jgi:hypothetical protein
MVAALGIAGAVEPAQGVGIRMREIAEEISAEFRKVMASIDAPDDGTALLADTIHELLVRGVIDPGLELFRAA